MGAAGPPLAGRLQMSRLHTALYALTTFASLAFAFWQPAQADRPLHEAMLVSAALDSVIAR